MSRHRNQPEMRRGISRFACSILSGLLLASQLVLPSITFALSARRASSADPPPTPSLAQSEVSVVRLVFDYTAKTASKGTTAGNPVLCTSLGVLVKSFPASTASGFNSWVLTDGSLLNTSPAPCAPTGSSSSGKPTTNYTLATINVYANTVYTGNTSANALLGTYNAVPANANANVCSATPCPNGAFLFAIHTDQLQPTLDMATANTTQQFGIALTNGTSPTARPPLPLSSTAGAVTFLNPASVSLAVTNSQNEVGMPIINNTGQMVAMRLQGNIQGNMEFTAADYTALVTQRAVFTAAPANPLQAAWERGITAYYSQHYQDAIKDFQGVESLNPRFKAAKTFELQATALSHSQGNPAGGSSVTPSGNTTFFDLPRSTFLIIGIAAGFLLLIVLLIIVSVWARRRHELARFEAEQVEAQRNAEKEVQKMQHSRATAKLQPSSSELPCPSCGTLVKTTETFCPHCGVLLSASASGLHLQAMPSSPVAPQSQANYMQPSEPSAPSISELPTIEFSPASGSIESDVTLPYGIEQLQSRNLSLAVGYLTDPGIKRKHKPNEDSLFAMQGTGTYNSLPQEFGLFVVADGMGGHANGQDASRMAIQTIIDYILPRISANKQMKDEAFVTWLRDGVQCANQAVHQRNLEERADMGTTMNAALVVGATAYVANVGDSRTYLYREPGGLAKITHDHSVVASLVEAGIIKPDDIYTHPKRNQIYRSLGEKPAVDVDSFIVSLKAGDKLLLCSDGLWDMVRDPEIQRLMSAPAPAPSKTGQKLIQAALDGGGEDNISVIVVTFSEAEVTLSSQAGMNEVQLLYKPETVTVPDLPQL
jgi:serine/threonine protein phosphatase PrpC